MRNWFTKPTSSDVVDMHAPATETDVFYCYKLFLRRAPDEEGMRFWRAKLQREHVSVADLVQSFVVSEEFGRVNAVIKHVPVFTEGRRVERIELPDFAVYINRDDGTVGTAIASTHTYEPEVMRELNALLKPGDVYVDIGANIGFLSMLAAKRVGLAGTVIAFEPNPDNCALLRLSAQENGFRHVQVYQNAVADVAQSFMLESDGSNGRIITIAGADSGSTFGATDETALSHTTKTIVVAVVLDDMLAAQQRIDVIKIDIEGAEPRALAGMHALLKRHRPVIVSEFSPELIKVTSKVAPETYLNDLRSLGYALHVITDDGIAPLPESYADVEAHVMKPGREHIDILCRPL